MSAPTLRIVPDLRETDLRRFSRSGRMTDLLLDWGVLSPGNLALAQALDAREDTHIRDILLAKKMVSPAQLAEATALEWNTTTVDLTQMHPDARMIDAYGADLCLREGFVPCRRIGASTLIATARPERLARLIKSDPGRFADCHMAIAPERDIEAAVTRTRSDHLVRLAESRVPAEVSCRNWALSPGKATFAAVVLITFIALVFAVPALFAFVCAWGAFSLFLICLMRIGAWWHCYRSARDHTAGDDPHRRPALVKLPRVSIMVPLFKESALAAHLVTRLSRLEYPKELLEILLVCEADDEITRQTIENTDLPGWMRVISVPKGTIKTKPRALNYALDFCRGSIIGIYDAEDAPAPDQIHRVVQRFHERGPEVACLQGILDFYNAPTNWLSRCFTVEYASWFRVVLPGIQRLGFAIPLGGTTMFFRRAALESLGAWDAHNVTEDADLGMRLARRGYRAEFVETVTEEEANCRTIPWIKQRSRWLKGYAMTWAVHMRSPVALYRDLGAWKFIGFQLLFLGALSQFVLAPFLWSFWLILFGLPHPLTDMISNAGFLILTAIFISSEVLGIAIACYALRGDKHRWLRKWVPTLILYYPLGALASYKGLWEMLTRPYYWDKTTHGVFPAVKSPE